MVRRSYGIGSALFALVMVFGVGDAFAQANVMKACGAEWQAAKDAKKVKPGETWNSFLADCRKRHADDDDDAVPPEPAAAAKPAAPAAAAKPAAAPAAAPAAGAKPVAAPAAAAKPAAAPAAAAPAADEKPLTPGQIAARERIKKCGAEWTAAKEAGKIKAGQKWPQYWSDCNKRLKAAGQ
ncbi:MAG: hypothetical protein OEL76_17570 [Siculibacillus sp.]|nr:hypothetical protein [Siculibacillus sp.]